MLALERTLDFIGIEFRLFDIRNWVFALKFRQALNSGYFFLNLPNAGTAGMCYHIQLNRDFWCSIKYQSRRFCLIGGAGNDRDPSIISSLTIFPQSEFKLRTIGILMINNNLFLPLCSLIFINLLIHHNFFHCVFLLVYLILKHIINGNCGGLKGNGPQRLWHYGFLGVCVVLEEVCHCRGLSL